MIRARSCNARGTKRRAFGTLELFRRLAMAVVVAILCVGVAVPGWASPRLVAAALGATARDATAADHGLRRSEPSQWQPRDTARRDVVVKAVESDGDEDDDRDDALRSVDRVAAFSLRCVPVRPKPDRASRGELAVDTSRFTAGPRLPRGPPARAS